VGGERRKAYVLTLDFLGIGLGYCNPSTPSVLGEGVYSEFQVTRMIERGQKSKPKKSLGLPTKPLKNPCTKD